MPTQNPRLTITLTPEVSAVLRELSSLAGNSQSGLVGDLLQTSLPIFERMVQAMKAAAQIQETAREEIGAGLERAQAKLEEQLGLALDTLDEGFRPILGEAEGIVRRGAGGGGARRRDTAPPAAEAVATPRPLTGGSGPHKRATQGSRKVPGRGRV